MSCILKKQNVWTIRHRKAQFQEWNRVMPELRSSIHVDSQELEGRKRQCQVFLDQHCYALPDTATSCKWCYCVHRCCYAVWEVYDEETSDEWRGPDEGGKLSSRSCEAATSCSKLQKLIIAATQQLLCKPLSCSYLQCMALAVTLKRWPRATTYPWRPRRQWTGWLRRGRQWTSHDRKISVNLEALWSTLKHFEALWSTLKHFEALWSTLKHFEALWSTLKHFGSWDLNQYEVKCCLLP